MVARPAASPADGLPSLSEVIERVGFGLAQVRVGLLGGCVWLTDGAELLLIGAVTHAVSEEWHLRPWQRGSVVSILFCGILLGNFASGPLGDHYGRRLPILASYLGIAFFSILSAHAQDFQQLAFIRLLVGASFGIGQPAISALSTEVSPSYWRITMSSLTQALFIVGELYSAVLVWWDDPMMHNLDWRWLVRMGAIPSMVCFVLSYLFLHQSPSYLALRGEYDQAKAVLESFADDNGRPGMNCDFHMQPPKKVGTAAGAAIENLRIIFSPRFLYSTIAVMYSTFTLNVVLYGCLYAFPQVVTVVNMHEAPAVALILGAFWEFPGNIMGAMLGMFFPRKPVIAGYLVATFLSLVAFGVGATQMKGGSEQWLHFELVSKGYIGIKCFVVVGFVAVYQYSTEIFPTAARTTGTAACVAGGRVGGMIAPLLYEWLADATDNVGAFFYCIAALCLLNLVFVFFLPFETFGKSLDSLHEEGEVQPLMEHKAVA